MVIFLRNFYRSIQAASSLFTSKTIKVTKLALAIVLPIIRITTSYMNFIHPEHKHNRNEKNIKKKFPNNYFLFFKYYSDYG